MQFKLLYDRMLKHFILRRKKFMYKYTQEKNTAKLAITVSAKEWEEFLESAYQKNKGKYSVQGFRKGFAPRKMIEKNYGATIFADEALELAVGKEYYAFLEKEKNVEPVSEPDVKVDGLDDKGLKVTLTVDTKPEIELGKYTDLTVTKGKEKITDKQIKNEIDGFLNSQARYNETENAAKLGDFVTMDFVGKIDGVAFAGGTAEDYRLELGSHSFIDGFEDQLVGTKKGDTKDANVTFPKEYHAEELKGKPAIFTCTIKKVEEKIIPELTDELVSNATESDTVEVYKESIKKRLSDELEKKQEREVENKLLEEIVKASKVEIPNGMIEDQLDMFINDFAMRLQYQGMKLEDYMRHTNTTLEAMRKEKKATAENTVKTRLAIEKIVKENKIKVTDKEIDAKLSKRAEAYKTTVEEYKKKLGDRELMYLENDIIMDKFFKFLKEKNNIN